MAAHGKSTRAGLELSETSRCHQPRLTAQKGLLWDAEVLASIHASVFICDYQKRHRVKTCVSIRYQAQQYRQEENICYRQILWKCYDVLSHSVVSDSLQPHGLSPARLLCPWDSPGKNTGVGCHVLLGLGDPGVHVSAGSLSNGRVCWTG